MEKEEFSRRVNAMMDRLYRISYGQLREPQDRMDAIQDALLKAWVSREKLRNAEYFETWLIRILINECHNHQHRLKRNVCLDVAPEPAAAFNASAELRGAVLALPEKQRMAVILHYMEGYSIAEAAHMLRVPAETVRSRLKKARSVLKTVLEDT